MNATVGTAYAVVVTAVVDPRSVEGLEWDRAVEYLPSIASRAMRTWLNSQEDVGGGIRHPVVIPGSRRRAALRQLPNREVCVPSAEYLLFTDAVRADVRARRAGSDSHSDSRVAGSTDHGSSSGDRRRPVADGIVGSDDRLAAAGRYPGLPIGPGRSSAMLTAR
ncbi:hypothetical protein HLB23_24950 [Nocardia uniformis]|uniref:Uncharacterized protein n=1 Tax=Nocardia uniformis TaxID=53432 RepID=A0A849C9M6_9NOCA|nr:hypothetical protein [Nocardia uniformis]NNH73070.1 hypothetical protein [Nocardia uniformis]